VNSPAKAGARITRFKLEKFDANTGELMQIIEGGEMQETIRTTPRPDLLQAAESSTLCEGSEDAPNDRR